MPRLPPDPRYYLNLSRTASFTEDSDKHTLSVATPTAPEQRIESHTLRGFFRGCIAAQSSSFSAIKQATSRFCTTVTALGSSGSASFLSSTVAATTLDHSTTTATAGVSPTVPSVPLPTAATSVSSSSHPRTLPYPSRRRYPERSIHHRKDASPLSSTVYSASSSTLQNQCRLLLIQLMDQFNDLLAIQTAYTAWKAEVIGVAEMGTIIPSTLHIATVRNMLRTTLQRNDVLYISRIQAAFHVLEEWSNGLLGGELTSEYPPKLAIDELVHNLHEWIDQRIATLVYDRSEFLPWISTSFDRTASNATLSQILLGGILNPHETAAVLRWILHNQEDERTKQRWKATLASGIGFERAQELLHNGLDTVMSGSSSGSDGTKHHESEGNPYYALDYRTTASSNLLRPLRTRPLNVRTNILYDTTSTNDTGNVLKNRTLSPLAERILRKSGGTTSNSSTGPIEKPQIISSIVPSDTPEQMKKESVKVPWIQSSGESTTDPGLTMPQAIRTESTTTTGSVQPPPPSSAYFYRPEGMLSPHELLLEGGQSPIMLPMNLSSSQPKITTEEDTHHPRYRTGESSSSSSSSAPPNHRFHFLDSSSVPVPGSSSSSSSSSIVPNEATINTVRRQLSVGLGHTESNPDNLRTRVLARLNSFNFSPSPRAGGTDNSRPSTDYTLIEPTPFPLLHATVSEPLPFVSITEENEDEERINAAVSPPDDGVEDTGTDTKRDRSIVQPFSLTPPLGQWRGKYRDEMSKVEETNNKRSTITQATTTVSAHYPMISRQDTEFQGLPTNGGNDSILYRAIANNCPLEEGETQRTSPSPLVHNTVESTADVYPSLANDNVTVPNVGTLVPPNDSDSGTYFLRSCGWCIPWFTKRTTKGPPPSSPLSQPQLVGGKGTMEEPYVIKGVPNTTNLQNIKNNSRPSLLNPVDIPSTTGDGMHNSFSNSEPMIRASVVTNDSPSDTEIPLNDSMGATANQNSTNTTGTNIPFYPIPLYGTAPTRSSNESTVTTEPWVPVRSEEVQRLQDKNESLIQRLRNRRSKYTPSPSIKDTENKHNPVIPTKRPVSSDVLAIQGRQQKRKG